MLKKMSTFKATLRRHGVSSALIVALAAGCACTVIYPETTAASREAAAAVLQHTKMYALPILQSGANLALWLSFRPSRAVGLLLAMAALLHAFSLVVHLRQGTEGTSSRWRRPHRHEVALFAIYLVIFATEMSEFAIDPADTPDLA